MKKGELITIGLALLALSASAFAVLEYNTYQARNTIENTTLTVMDKTQSDDGTFTYTEPAHTPEFANSNQLSAVLFTQGSPTAPLSTAMGRWSPTQPGECTKEQHDAYSAVSADDGKRYPVWHPPVDPSGCSYGHEHGNNPSTSPLSKMGPILFGYVNETFMNAAPADTNVHRHEDHVGHKVVVASNVLFNPAGLHGTATPLYCDVLTKLHQGTHSPDAFTNSLHEQVNRMTCDDGTFVNTQLLSQIGPGGQFQQQCGTQTRIEAGTASPTNSPRTASVVQRGGSMGNRFLPTDFCMNKTRPSYFEIWKTQNGVARLDGNLAFGFAWYWAVSNPSRYYDPTKPNKMGRTIDTCWLKDPVLDQYLVISNPCVNLRKEAMKIASSTPGLTPQLAIPWDSKLSPFNGTQRSLRVDSFTLRNSAAVGGVETWYTDAFGLRPSKTPFPGSLKQTVSVKSHTPNQYAGRNLPASALNTSVHAPN